MQETDSFSNQNYSFIHSNTMYNMEDADDGQRRNTKLTTYLLCTNIKSSIQACTIQRS